MLLTLRGQINAKSSQLHRGIPEDARGARMSSLRWKAWLFDLDGTLAHTAPELSQALNQTLTELGHEPVEEALAMRWIGHGTQALVARALAHATGADLSSARQDRRLMQALACFDHHYQAGLGSRSLLYPGVLETLTALRERGGRLAVVTNKEGRHTRPLLQALGLQELVDLIVCGDTLPTRKPDPAGVRWCLERWALRPDQAVFVGDSDIDAQTARGANLQIYLMRYGYNAGRDVGESRPDRVLDHFGQILL